MGPRRSQEQPTNEIQTPLRHGINQPHERLRATQQEVGPGRCRGPGPRANHHVGDPPPAETVRQSTDVHPQ